MTDPAAPQLITQFIVWAHEIDAAFRAAYVLTSGEEIQSAPALNQTQTHYMAGSSRLDSGVAADLLAEPDFAGALYIGASPPAWWLPEAPEEG